MEHYTNESLGSYSTPTTKTLTENSTKSSLKQKGLIVLELMAYLIVGLSITLVGMFLGFIFLYLRKKTWKDLGLKKPEQLSAVVRTNFVIVFH